MLRKSLDDVKVPSAVTLADINDPRVLEIKKVNFKQIEDQISVLENQITEYLERIRSLNSWYNYYSNAQQYVATNVVEMMNYNKEAQMILFEEIGSALKSNKEFFHPFFTKGLLSVIKNDKTIQLVPIDPKRLFVKVNLNETAGSISDYANSIKKVREEFKRMVRNKELSPQEELDELAQRNKFWEEKFYAPAREGKTVTRRKYNRKTKQYEKRDVTSEQILKYWNTLRKRQEYWGKPAPYWELLDRGVKAMEESSGKPYPVPVATNFVEKTINRISTEFTKHVESKLRSLNEDIRSISREISFYSNKVSEIRSTIEDLEKQLHPEAMFVAKVERLGREFSKEKFMKVFEALSEYKLGNISITKEGRVEITAPGQKRFRVRIGTIIRKFNMESGW